MATGSLIRNCLCRTFSATTKLLPRSSATPLMNQNRNTIILPMRNSFVYFHSTYSHPLAMGNPHYSDDYDESKMTPFMEAIEIWRKEAKTLHDAMITNDFPAEELLPQEISNIRNTQVSSLIDEMIEEGTLDPRFCYNADY